MIGIRRLHEASVRRHLGLALFVSCLACALLVTLWPFRFSLATASFARIDWRLYYRSRTGHVTVDRDLLQNLVMLAPLGAGWALLRGPRGVGRIALEATVLGVGLAAAIETLQIFLPSRCPQLADVWRNGAGCVAGAVLVAWLVPHVLRITTSPPYRAVPLGDLDMRFASEAPLPRE
jgi:glycopeptide antibiotics resistance protein